MIVRIIITLAIYAFIGGLVNFFYPILPNTHYEWYWGILHGLLLPVNFIRSLFVNTYLKADAPERIYDIVYWICAAISTITLLFAIWRQTHDNARD